MGAVCFLHYMTSSFLNSRESLFIHLSFKLFISLIGFSFFIAIITQVNISISLLFLLQIPVACSFSSLLCTKKKSLLQLFNSQLKYSPQCDYLIRLLAKEARLEYEDYKVCPDSIFIDMITVRHQMYCPSFPKCFCNIQEIKKYEDYIDNILISKQRKRYLGSFIYDLFCGFNQHKIHSLEGNYSFISYLIDIKKSKVQSFCQIIKLKIKSTLSFRQLPIVYELFNKARRQFDDTIGIYNSRAFTRGANYLKGLKDKKDSNSNYQQNATNAPINKNNNNNSKQEDHNSGVKDFFCGIQFDEELNELEALYNTTLQSKEILVKMLCSDYIDLVQLRQKAIQYHDLREKTQLKLQHLCKIHYNSQKLQYYIDRFIIIMAFGQKKKSLFKPKGFRKSKQTEDGKTKAVGNTIYSGESVDQRIFEKDNCVVFLTLIEPIGVVKRVQNKFENMFGISCKDIINENITDIIPQPIAQKHDQFLRGYIEEQNSIGENTPGSQAQFIRLMPLLLAKNSKGWAVPISLECKPDYLGLDDFGLSAHLHRIKTDSAFVMTSNKYFQVQLLSEVLYEKLLNEYFNNESEIKKIFLNRMIPLLAYFEKMWTRNTPIDTSNSNTIEYVDNSPQLYKQVVRTVAFLPKIDQTSVVNNNNRFSLFNLAGEQVLKHQKQFFFTVLEFASLEKELKKYSCEKLDIYSIKLQFQYRKSRLLSYNLIEIKSLKKITKLEEQKSHITFFSHQMKVLLNINYPLKHEIDRIDLLLQGQVQVQALSKEESFIHQKKEEDLSQFELIVNKEKLLVENLIGEQVLDSDIFSHYQVRQSSFQEKSQSILSPLRKFEAQKSLFKIMQDQVDHIEAEDIKSSQIAKNVSNNNDFKQANMNIKQQEDAMDLLLNKSSTSNMHQNNIVANNSLISPILAQDFSTSHRYHLRQSLSCIGKSIHLQIENMNYTQENMLLKSYTQNDNPLTSDRSINPLQGNGQNTNQHEQTDGVICNNSMIENILFQGNAQDFTERGNNTNTPKQDETQMHLNEEGNDFQRKISQKKPTFFQLLKQKLAKKFQEDKNNIKQDEIEESSHPQILDNDFMQTSSVGTKTLMNQQSDYTKYKTQRTSTHKLQDLYKTTRVTEDSKANLAKQDSNYNEVLQMNYAVEGNHSEIENDANEILKKKHHHQIDLNPNQNNTSISETDDYFNEEELNIRKQKLMTQAASSIHTSKSANYDQKRTLKYQINSKKKSFLMIMLTVFGFLSFSAIFALTLFQYFNTIRAFSLASKYFSFVAWPMSIRSSFVMTMNEDAVISLINHKAFDGIDDNNFLNAQKEYFSEAVDQFLSLYKEYENSDQSSLLFLKQLNNQMQLILSVDDNVSINKFTFNQNEKVNKTTSIQFFINIVSSYLYQMQFDLTNVEKYQKIQSDNFSLFNTKLVEIQAIIQIQTNDLINSILAEVLLLLILVVVVSVILIFAIFPLYSFVQMKNESLLKLFATIQPEHLKAMLLPIQIALNESRSQKLKYFEPEPIKKKKTISATGTIPKFKPLLLLFSLFSFILIIIQPIINYVLVNSFRSEAIMNINLLMNLYDLKATFISSIAINFQYINKSMFPDAQRVPQILIQNQQKLSQMYTTIQSSQNSNRFQQSYYDNFLYKIFNSNICEALQNYPQFAFPLDTMEYSECASINKGSLVQGFQYNVKLFLNVFVDWYNFYQDQSSLKQSMIQWESQNKFQQFDKFYRTLFSIIDLMKNFMLTMLNNQLDYNKIVQTVLLFFQLLSLSVVFILGWLKFYFYVQNEMFVIKSLISTINIEIVLDNPYIVSYLGD